MIKKFLLTICLLALPLQVWGATTSTTITTTGAGTWTAPIGVTSVQVECRAGGGGTGGLTTDTNYGIGGGAGGQYSVDTSFPVTPLTTYNLSVGIAGTAGSATGPTNGGQGGTTWFGSNDSNGVVAIGGLGSLGNNRTGRLGTTAGGYGDTVNAGGNGADSVGNVGGGGGEGAGSAGTGGNASGATGGSGTDGGNGGNGGTNAQGTVGTAPGGSAGGSGTTTTTNRAGRAGGAGNLVLTWTIPPISALTDNFNGARAGNAVNTAKWVTGVSGTGSATNETNGQIELVCGTSASNYAYLWSPAYYDLTGSQTTIKIIDAGLSASSYDYYFHPLYLYLDGSNRFRWEICGGELRVSIWVADSETQPYITTYVAATHKYLRIRESSGTLYFDYSSDGVNWTNAYSEANPFAITSLQAVSELKSYVITATTAKVDSFNLTPETSVLDRTKCKLLAHFNGANGATTYTSDDASARTATFYNSAQLSTTQKVFGTASLLLASATSDYLTFPDSDDWAQAGDFEMGCRVWFNNLPAAGTYMTVFTQYQNLNNRWRLQILEDTGIYNLSFWYTYAGSDIVNYWSTNLTLSTNTFYYFAISKSGDNFYMWLNGTQVNTTQTTAFTIANLTGNLYVGQKGEGSQYLDGYIDELYIINGQALHTSMYEPIDVEYSLSAAGGTPMAAYYYHKLMQGEGY